MKRKLAVILLGAALTITGCGMTAGASETGTETAAEEVITEAESETATAKETESASDTEEASETEIRKHTSGRRTGLQSSGLCDSGRLQRFGSDPDKD